MMPDHSSTLPAQLQRNRTSQRSRPSLAAFADSGYAPSSQPVKSPSSRHATLTRSNARNTLRALSSMREEAVADGSDPFDLGVASQLTEESFARERAGSFRTEQPPTMRSVTGFYGEDGGTIRGGTIRRIGTANSRNNYPTHRQDSGSSQYPQPSTISRSATISSAWSFVSNRLFVESIRNTGSDDSQRNQFTENFDELAKKHGVQPFPKKFSDEPGSASVSSESAANSGASTPAVSGNKFLNMLLRRTPSTIDVSKHHGNTKLTKRYKRSTSANDIDVVGKGKRDSLKGMHLEDMIRLGGVAIFNLPLGLSPGDLLIPTCMHAAASYILNNGIRKQGIFRVSGNVNTTFALYDFYQRQLEENNNESVVATTALARLPTNIPYNVHDVAHLLKKLIYGLPGGLLGTPPVFQALYNVHTFVYPDPSLRDEMIVKVKPRMIALAISAINLHFRITLICAVFGLLRAINIASEQETQSKVKDPHETFVQMRDDSLGTVFAPLLLGDKSQHILVDESDDRGGLLVLPALDPNGHATLNKDKSELHKAKKEAERMRRAAIVAQMLIDNWEDISYEMKRINTLGVTAQAYDLPTPQTQNTVRRGLFKHLDEEQLQKVEYMPAPERQKSSTVRGTYFEKPLFADSQSRSRRASTGTRRTGNRSGELNTGSQTPIGDLLRFDSHKPNRKALDQDLFTPPTELGMSPIAESIATRSISTPQREPESTPNWRAFSNSTPTKLASPFRQQPASSPNWRNLSSSTQLELENSPDWPRTRTPSHSDLHTTQGTPNWLSLHQTPSRSDLVTTQSTPNWLPIQLTPDRSEFHTPQGTPNWLSLHQTPSRSDLVTTQSTPNWLSIQQTPDRSEFHTPQGTPNWRPLQQTPSELAPQSPPNWRNIQTPSQVGTDASPNWHQLPAPNDPEPEGSPNWRLIDTDVEGILPVDTPTRKFQIPYVESELKHDSDQVSLAPSHADDTHSSGTSSGAATPPQDVTPQVARRIVAEFGPNSMTSFKEVVLRNSPVLSAPAELNTPEPERRKPSIYGRRAISPVREVLRKKNSQELFTDPEDLEEYRPTTPKPLTFRKKASSFSIYEDEPNRTPKTQRSTMPVHSPILSLRKPNSHMDVNISPKGKKAAPSRDLLDSPARPQSTSVPLQPATPNRKSRASMDSDVEIEVPSPEKRPIRGGNTALYAEIRRLQRLVDLKSEEANHTRKELELAQNMAKAGTLSQIVRETQEELRMWKNRAEWAEQKLKQMNISIEGQGHRYSIP